MADSDDEYDHKRRDKFRGERSSGESYRSDRRDERRVGMPPMSSSRDDWPDRSNNFRGSMMSRQRPDYRDYRPPPRERFVSPCRDMPVVKRMRPDWSEDMRGGPRYGLYDPYMMQAWNEHYAASQSMHGAYGSAGGASFPTPHAIPSMGREVGGDIPTQPQMMSLKQFLYTQDDGISDAEVLRKYNDYKLEFKRQQLNEFFIAHKDEEWFKNKYHPNESAKRKEEHLKFLKKRVEVFNELYQNGFIKRFSVDTTQTDALLRLLDTVVIKLEGGTNFDLKILEDRQQSSKTEASALAAEKTDDGKLNNSNTTDDDVVIITDTEKSIKKEADSGELGASETEVSREKEETKKEEDKDVDLIDERKTTKSSSEEGAKLGPHFKALKKKGGKRRRLSDSTKGSSSDSNSSSDSSSDDDEDDDEDDEVIKSKYDLELIKKENAEEDEQQQPLKTLNEGAKEGKKDCPETSENKNGKPSVEGENVQDCDRMDESVEVIDISGTSLEEGEGSKGSRKSSPAFTATQESTVETIDLDNVKDNPEPRALHRTSSIFLRNLAPTITKGEIEAICTKFSGYLRVAIADPLAERRWYRRGWVTFKRDVNIKEICWSLNNTRLKDCEMGAIVNRDLSRRIRPVNGITAHKSVLRSDIKLCAKIVMNLDEKFNLWGESKPETPANVEQTAEVEANMTDSTAATEPASEGEVLNNKSDGNAEMDNKKATVTDNSSGFGFTSKNPVLHNITDFLIEEASAEEEELLGISNENSKTNEGESIERDPQLISVLDSIILYLRIVHSVDFYNHCEYPYEDEMPNRCGIIHARGPAPSKVSQNDIQEYIKNFETKIQMFISKAVVVDDDELKNLGCKDAEAEVQKFIQANTQELQNNIWLCPLSGKKFKGPEFIRKHIMKKHAEKVEEVRKEVEFFNNYLKDPKRPQLPEHPGNTKRTPSDSMGSYRTQPFYPPAAPPYAPQPYASALGAGVYNPAMVMAATNRGGRGFPPHLRNRLGTEYRQIIQYRDLDAPQEPIDMFN